MGALNMGLTEEELPEIVRRWRSSNKRIVDLWYSIENAALSVMKTGQAAGVKNIIIAHEGDYKTQQDFLTITLPSGRKLFYARPFIAQNDWGKDSIQYHGMNQNTKKWETVPTYGGKLTENIVQAIARDCLAENIKRLSELGYKVVFHVHDEVIIDCLKEYADLDRVCKIMSQSIPWAQGLPLGADGFTAEFYKKD
jgi:DNA polymerase